MKPAFYLRVSTKSQDFPSQLHAIKEFCRRSKFPAPAKVSLFAEKESGAKAKRRELDRLLQACRDGKFDTIITYRADRLGRSFPHMAQLYEELKTIRIRVIGVSDAIDTLNDTPGTRALFRMLATSAEMQREIIQENTRAGLAAARAKGHHPGRPRKNDAKIAQALKLKAQGKTFTEILKRTKLSRGYLSGILNGKHSSINPSPQKRVFPPREPRSSKNNRFSNK